MCRFVEKLLFVLTVVGFSNGDITEQEYASMPKIFHLDDYEYCLMNKTNHYCLFTYELAPLNPENPSKMWELIQFISSDRMKYRHDWLRHGLCITDIYSNNNQSLKKNETEIKKFLQEMYDKKYEHLGLHGTVTEMKCETSDLQYKVSFFDHFIKSCLIAYIAFIIFVSVYDMTFIKQDTKNQTSTYGKIVTAFSLPRNWKKLTTVVDTPDSLRLRSFQGIRSLSLLVVIFSHCTMVAFIGFNENPEFLESILNTPISYFFINGVLLVQNFFLMSSWLLTYFTFERWYQKERISFAYVLKLILGRYVRLTPVLLVVLLFHLSWLPHISSGPLWGVAVVEEHNNCIKNWWKNLLYINNFGDISDMCMQHTWYLGNDTFYFIIGILFLCAIWKHKKYFLEIVTTVTILFQAGVFIYLYVNKYDVSSPIFPEFLYMANMLRVEQLIIGRSWYVNISGLFAGLIWGYIYFKYKNVDIPKTKVYLIFYYLSFYTVGGIIIYSPGYLFLEKNIDRHSPLMAGYCVLSRFFSPFTVGYLLFLLSHNISVGLKGLLESKIMVMLARTSYSLYMVHVTFNYVRTGRIRHPTFISHYQIASDTCADFVFSLVFAWILTLLVEFPMTQMMKIIFPVELTYSNERVYLKNINNNNNNVQNGHEEKLKNK